MTWHFENDHGNCSWRLYEKGKPVQGMILLEGNESGHYYTCMAFHPSPPYTSETRASTLQDGKGLVVQYLERRKS